MSYLQLPKDTGVHATAHQVDILSSKTFTSSDFFEEKCFDSTWKVQNKLYNKDRLISRRLLLRSIPTLLPHTKLNTPRLFSEKRVLAQRKEEVIHCFTKGDPEYL